MQTDEYGQYHMTADDLFELLYVNPDLNLQSVKVDDPERFNLSIEELYYDISPLSKYKPPVVSVEEFDLQNQQTWFMPQEYKNLDIAKWLLDQCKEEHELQRVGQELIMFQNRNLLDLLRFLKYFVDTMRKNNIVWGVGRGSSTASYCLFLIGCHKINSIYYGLDIDEFLK